MTMSDYLDTVEDGIEVVKNNMGKIGKALGWCIDEGILWCLMGFVTVVIFPFWIIGKVVKR